MFSYAIKTEEEKDHPLTFRTTTSVSPIQAPSQAEVIFFFSFVCQCKTTRRPSMHLLRRDLPLSGSSLSPQISR